MMTRPMVAEIPRDPIPDGQAHVITRPNGSQVVLVERPFYERIMADAGYELVKKTKAKDPIGD